MHNKAAISLLSHHIFMICGCYTTPYFYSFNLMESIVVTSSMDSDLEAFSHYPTHGSFTPLAYQLGVNTNYVTQRFLSY